MAEFSYKAIDARGKTKNGKITANNLDLAQDKLKSQGLTITSIREAGALDKDINISLGQKKVKPGDLAMFCKQFASILRAGVTIITALDMIADSTGNKSLAMALKDMSVSVEKGNNLADSMRMHPKVFPPMLINMVAAGEASGSLETSLDRMSDHFEKDSKLQGQIKSAMTYPIIVCIVAIAVVIVCMVVVIPNFTGMFLDMDMQLPLMTRVMVAISDFIIKRWYVLLVIIAAIVVGIKVLKKSTPGAYFFAKMALKAPIFGDLNIKTASARFARTMSTLMAAGIPLLDAVESVAKIMSNRIIRDHLMDCRDQVAKGIPLSQPMKSRGLFPVLLVSMTKIGEETGNLESMLFKVADFYDEQVDQATKSLTDAMEPLIMIVLAGIVGAIVAAVYGPLISMYKNMDSL